MTITADRARLILTRLPDDIALLPLVLTGNGAGDHTSRTTPGSRPPLRVDVLDLIDNRLKSGAMTDDPVGERDLEHQTGEGRRAGLLWELAQWTRLADEEMHNEQYTDAIPLADPPTVVSECGWLRLHLDWLTSRDWWPELARDLSVMDREVCAALGIRPEYVPRHTCGWRLVPRDGGTWYACTGCDAVVDHWAELKRLTEVQDVPLTELAGLIDVPRDTLRRWVEVGWLVAAEEPRRSGRRGQPEKRYNVAAARAVLATRARRGTS